MVKKPKELVPEFFNHTASSYDKIVKKTTFGKDNFWKKEIIKNIPKNSSSILDLACGTGILTKRIFEKFPNANIMGVDITSSYLEIAKQRLSSYPNVSFQRLDAEKLNLNEKFDCITSSYIPKYCDAETLIETCLLHLNPGGKIILHDFVYPPNPIIRGLWNFYFVILDIYGHFVPDWKNVFLELAKLIQKTTWLKDYEKVMKNHGLLVKKQFFTLGSSAILSGSLRA